MKQYRLFTLLWGLILSGLMLQAQKSVSISGTIVGAYESHIRNVGGDSIIIRLTGEKWVTGMGDNNDSTATLIHSFTGFRWDSIASKLNHLNVNLYNDSTVGIGLPVVPAYDIYQNETYTLTLPGSVLLSQTPLGSTASFTIYYIAPTVVVSGPVLDDNEDSIRLGRGKIILTLFDDEWESVIGTNDNATRDLVQAITGSSSWNDKVINEIVGSNKGDANVSVYGQVVTISIPSVPDYDISSNDLVTVNIPENALVHTGTMLNNVGTFTIMAKTASAAINNPGLSEANLNGSVIRISLLEETFNAGVTLTADHFSVNGPATTTISSVSKIDSVKADLTIGFTGDFDSDFTDFHITALNTGLTGTADLTSQNITVTATSEPHINSVTIPNTPFKIGSVIPVTIWVANDGGSVYSYAGGQVAERNLDSLRRNSSTNYTGYFTVTEGSKEFPGDSIIRVQNLRLDNGAIEGDMYSGIISQPNDVIDTHKPIINSFIAVGNSHKTGDKVRLVAIASEAGCTVVPALSSINGITYSSPKMSMTNSPPSNTYYIDYLVEEGDNDVLTPGTLSASLVFRDAGGNESSVMAVNTSNSVTIDAHKPVISTLFVPDVAYKIGNVVTLTINTDGSGHYIRNDSHINNIYYSSGRINFYTISPGIYRITYTVLGSDPEINPGNMAARIIMNDEAGNSSDPKTVIEPNTAAVYTVLPTASISGNAVICSGDSTRLFINLTGRKPWRITVNNGTSDQFFSDINSSPFSYYVKPVTNTSYTVKSVYDVNNQAGTTVDTAHVTVNQKSPVHITGLESHYFYRTDSIEIVQLTADSSGGVFSGPGVVSSANEFYPSIAGLAEIDPHVIRYDYTNRFGCKSYDTANVFVIEAIGVLNFNRPLKGNDDVLCFNDSPVEITAVIGGSNPVIATIFALFKDDEFIPPILAQNTQTTTINPAALSHGTYRIDFYYYTKTWLRISRKFMVEEVKVPEFVGFDIDKICSNDEEIVLRGTDPEGVFSGPGVSLNVSGRYYFDPGSVVPDNNYTITYTSSTPAGCQNSSGKTIRVNLMPSIRFGVEDSCLSSQELVVFTNNSTYKNRIRDWLWDFGDINSGALNYDTSLVGSHVFSTPVAGTIKLSGTTYEGCSSTHSRIVGFSDTPIGRFSVDNKCFVPDSTVTIDSKNSTSIRPISNYEWRVEFREDSVGIYSGSSLNKLNVRFPSVSIYPVELRLTTDLGCKSDTYKDTLVLRPTIVLNQSAPYYEETFGGWGSWSPQTLEFDKPHSWLHHISPPDLSTTPNDSSWYIVLNGDSSLVKSALLSPCFDLTWMKRPMIKMDISRSFTSENLEGAALQYTLDNGTTWLPVGKLEDGINWYNSYLINNLPQVIGWTGNPLTKDTTWVEARHGLDNLAGKKVQFRIAFVSNNYMSTSRFALDNIRISEKSRLSLLEYFTNTGTAKPSKDAEVNSIYDNRYHDFLKLEYHTGFPSSSDPFNLFDKSVPGARAYYYGINSIPYAILDGGTDLSGRFDFSQASLSLNEDDISVSTLYDPKVDIKISSTLNGSDLSVKVNLKAKFELPEDEKILFVVLYEKFADNAGTNYYNVVKTFLPDAGGTAIYQSWHANPQDTTKLEYDFARNVNDMNLSALRVAAFLQNDKTGEIYQAVTSDTSGITVVVRPGKELINEWKMFPNPAHEFVNIVFGGQIRKGTRLQIYNQMGIKMFEEEIKQYEEFKTINVNDFREGFYFVRLSLDGMLQSDVKKLVIMK